MKQCPYVLPNTSREGHQCCADIEGHPGPHRDYYELRLGRSPGGRAAAQYRWVLPCPTCKRAL